MVQGYQLNDVEMDVLKEVGNIGAGNAATVLSTMLGQRIQMTVPSVNLVPLTQVPEAVGGAELEMVGVCLGVTGDAPGTILFMLPVSSAAMLVDKLMTRAPGTTKSFGDMERSALGEMTNILTGAYLQALGELANIVLHSTVPALAIDMAGAILTTILTEVGRLGDYAFLIVTDFLLDGNKGVKGHFFLVPDPEALVTILKALGVKEWNQRAK